MSENSDFLTVPEAAKFLDIKGISVYVAKYVGKLKADRDASWKKGRICFARTEVERYKRECSKGRRRKQPKRVLKVVNDRLVKPDTPLNDP